MHDASIDDHDADQNCHDAYDFAAQAISLRAAFLPGPAAAWGQGLALATDLAGEAFCGPHEPTEDLPPPSWVDAKIGYDPASEAPPEFGSASHDDHADPAAFDFRADAPAGSGFAYDDPAAALGPPAEHDADASSDHVSGSEFQYDDPSSAFAGSGDAGGGDSGSGGGDTGGDSDAG